MYIPKGQTEVCLFLSRFWVRRAGPRDLVSCPASLSNKAKGERESGNFRNFSCICERASLNFQTTNQIVERFIKIANNSRISDIIVANRVRRP